VCAVDWNHFIPMSLGKQWVGDRWRWGSWPPETAQRKQNIEWHFTNKNFKGTKETETHLLDGKQIWILQISDPSPSSSALCSNMAALP
jgi:hypothetical protein